MVCIIWTDTGFNVQVGKCFRVSSYKHKMGKLYDGLPDASLFVLLVKFGTHRNLCVWLALLAFISLTGATRAVLLVLWATINQIRAPVPVCHVPMDSTNFQQAKEAAYFAHQDTLPRLRAPLNAQHVWLERMQRLLERQSVHNALLEHIQQSSHPPHSRASHVRLAHFPLQLAHPPPPLVYSAIPDTTKAVQVKLHVYNAALVK